MNINYLENGKIVISGDSELLSKFPDAKATDGKITGLRVDADILANMYSKADATETLQDVNNYLAMKDQFIKTYQR